MLKTIVAKKIIKMFLVLKTYRNRRYMNSHKKSQYASKVKCSTLKPSQNDDLQRGKFMLTLGDSTKDSIYEYKQKSIFFGKKNKRNNLAFNKKKSKSIEKKNQISDSSENILLRNSNSYNDNAQDNTVLTVFENPQKLGANSKAFMGSFGSWINDLFTVPSKRPHSSPKVETKPFQQEIRFDDDPEYFKSINDLKDRFIKRLKSETTIHIAGGEKFLEINFNRGIEKKVQKKSCSLTSFDKSSLENEKPLQESIQLEADDTNLPILINEDSTLLPHRTLNDLNLAGCDLLKNKKDKFDLKVFDEYILPKPGDLSKNLLLNLDDQERCSLYKNIQIGVQENGHFVQKKNKSYQNSTRCYTTNAVVRDMPKKLNVKIKPKSTQNVKNLHTKSDDSLSTSEMVRKKSRAKVQSEIIKDKYAFTKTINRKFANNAYLETGKLNSKASSDELLKYLMKKVRVHQSVPNKKKMVAHDPIALPAVKSKFMQSATSSLVMNALAKKENDALFSPKHSTRTDKNATKTLQNKTAIVKCVETNVKSKKKNLPSTLNKSTYLSDEIIDQSADILLAKNNYSKRIADSQFRLNEKDQTEKSSKKRETANILNRLDIRNDIYRLVKVKQREEKKGSVQALEDNLNVESNNQSGRFQHQHEIFKNGLKTFSTLESEFNASNEKEKEMECVSNITAVAESPTTLPMELSIVENSFQVPEEPSESIKTEMSEIIEDTTEIKDTESKGPEPANAEDQLNQLSNLPACKNRFFDKYPVSKDKLYKAKSLKFVNDDQIHVSAQHEGTDDLAKQKISGNKHEPHATGTKDVHSVKSLDTAIHRRYSPNPVSSIMKPKNKGAFNCKSYSSAYLDSEACGTDSEKQQKDKKRDKSKKGEIDISTLENECGFEKIKKPGPNCDGAVTS